MNELCDCLKEQPVWALVIYGILMFIVIEYLMGGLGALLCDLFGLLRKREAKNENLKHPITIKVDRNSLPENGQKVEFDVSIHDKEMRVGIFDAERTSFIEDPTTFDKRTVHGWRNVIHWRPYSGDFPKDEWIKEGGKL